MKRISFPFIVYLLATLLLPILLFYPAMIYYDLAGMGGYDGFASVELMQRHGMWRAASDTTWFFRLFEGSSLLWLLSLVNLLGFVVISTGRFIFHIWNNAQ